MQSYYFRNDEYKIIQILPEHSDTSVEFVAWLKEQGIWDWSKLKDAFSWVFRINDVPKIVEWLKKHGFVEKETL